MGNGACLSCRPCWSCFWASRPLPLEGGVGGPYYAPTSMDELEDHYQLAFGKLTLDLTQLPVRTEPVHGAAAVGAGGLHVIVPENAQVQVDSEVGGGAPTCWATAKGGTDLSNHYEFGDLGRLNVLDLSVGIGGIEVEPAYDDPVRAGLRSLLMTRQPSTPSRSPSASSS